MSPPASEMRQLLKDRAARKAVRKANEVKGPEPSLNKDASGTELRQGQRFVPVKESLPLSPFKPWSRLQSPAPPNTR